MTANNQLVLELKHAPEGKDPCRLCILLPANKKCNITDQRMNCGEGDLYYALIEESKIAKNSKANQPAPKTEPTPFKPTAIKESDDEAATKATARKDTQNKDK